MPTSKLCGVYKITCVPTGKVYIGSSVDIDARMRKHRWRLRDGSHSNPHLLAAWRLYGEQAFTFDAVELTDPDARQERERYWMDQYQATDRLFGFNLRDEQAPMKMHPESLARRSQTNRGKPRSEAWKASIRRTLNTPEVRAKLSAAHRGRTHTPEARAKMSAAQQGRTHTTETRAKLRAANLGKKLSPEATAKLQAANKATRSQWEAKRLAASIAARAKTYICTSPDGIEYEVHNLNAFCREHGLNAKNMALVASGKRPTHKGWRCRRVQNGETA